MLEQINEKVKAGVVFNGPGIRPKWFKWNSRHIKIRHINYIWKVRRGRDTLIYFAVSDGNDTFELSYSPKKSLWILTTVETE